MIAQGWGGAAGKAGNTEWQAVIVDAKTLAICMQK
jgi:hypothetical protein